MSKYDFILFAAQRDDFIERLRGLGLVDITTTGWEPAEEDRQLMNDLDGLAKAEEFIKAFHADPAHADREDKPYASGRAAYEAYVQAQQEASAARAEIARLEKLTDELRPWGAFDVARMHALAKQGVMLHYFSAQTSAFDKMHEEWERQYTLSLINRTESMAYFVLVTAPTDDLTLDAQEMKSPTMDYVEAERLIGVEQKRLSALEADFGRVAASEKLLTAYAGTLRERLQGVKVAATAEHAADGELLVMEGWAEKATSNKVDALLEEYPNVIYLKADPTPEDDTPVKLRNNWFAHIFEFVGDMYARPKYGSIDLTPYFAPFYMLFFGICLNDAGYGAILTLLGLWLVHKNPQPGKMHQAALFATMCGLMTTLFGGFCGSFFGMNLAEYFPSVPFFDFQNRFFSVALAIGMVQILFGMAINICGITHAFGFRYAFGQLGWFLILLAASIAGGLPMLNANWVIPFFTTSSPAFYAVVGVGAALMLFLNTPKRNPLLNLGPGVWNLYNNITGLLSDVLSYIRLFAIGLSGGVLALVFNSLAAGFVPEGSNIVVRILIMLPILLIGHGINLFMSTISSFVHPMRLTFVEFFKNAGFEMSTRTFDPIRKMNQTNE